VTALKSDAAQRIDELVNGAERQIIAMQACQRLGSYT
jgi:hypothetical protein